MLYLCHWEKYFRFQLINAWKNAFAKKFSEFNIFNISRVDEYDLNFYSQNLLSRGFFSEKNLFIIDDFAGLTWEKADDYQKYTDFFLEKLPLANPEHVIVFNVVKVDKRTKLFKLFDYY